jgi:predicted nucleic acid-binding Zn ribbon protein
MADDPIKTCEVCGAPVQRVFHPVAIHFKGKGFYNTDYGTKRKARELEKSANEGADKHDDKVASQKKEADKKAADAKPATAESKPKKD